MCTYIANRGSKESNYFNYVFTVAKLLTLAFIAFVAFTSFNTENFQPFFLEDKGGFFGTVHGATLLFFSYLGFDFITCLAEESKNPKKDMPVSIQLTIGGCCLIYCVVAVAISGIARLELLRPETAMA